MAVTRSSTATWVIPTISEWYKAGWYVSGGTNAGYWLYPTQNNNTPSYVLSATGTNNANFTTSISTPPFTTSSDPTDWLTPVGAFADSPSAYGTYDEGGDVEQWNEAVDPGIGRGGGGGSWAGDYVTLVSGGVGYGPPSGGGPTTGFRVALVPEPNSLLLLAPFAASLLIFGTIRWIPRSGKKARARQMRGSRQRIGCRWLRLERLEEKRLLTGLLYFDSAAGSSWNGDFWYQNQSFTGSAQYWADGSGAVFPSGSGTISIASGTHVSPTSITFFAGTDFTISGGEIELAANITVDVEKLGSTTTQAEIDSPISGNNYQLGGRSGSDLKL